MTRTTTEIITCAPLKLLEILLKSTATRPAEPEALNHATEAILPQWKAVLVIITVGLMTMMSTVLSGVLAVALLKIAKDPWASGELTPMVFHLTYRSYAKT